MKTSRLHLRAPWALVPLSATPGRSRHPLGVRPAPDPLPPRPGPLGSWAGEGRTWPQMMGWGLSDATSGPNSGCFSLSPAKCKDVGGA